MIHYVSPWSTKPRLSLYTPSIVTNNVGSGLPLSLLQDLGSLISFLKLCPI
ncbi:hypothetical protein [Staphylococcus phage vB_SauM-V1SA09]|nr:hypothetical protein [Staphylococcus phage vB_SauM-V1SA09]